MKSNERIACEELLSKHGFRVTSGRTELLLFLKQSKRPLSVAAIQKGVNISMDKVTLYRALEDFSKLKIITKVNLQSPLTYYEYIHDNHHHHHIICERCNTIEDIETCKQTNLQKNILTHSKKFSAVTSHSLEFFGICKECSLRA